MTSRILTPWHQRSSRASAVRAGADAHPLCRSTAILDWDHPAVIALADRLGRHDKEPSVYLRHAHQAISTMLRPVYGVRERQPVSRTIVRGRGSCSQRLALLEALARAAGIATRVEGLLVDGRFWYARAGRLWRLVPDQIVLAWPEFLIDHEWVSVSALYGPLDGLALCGETPGFTNTDAETLFEAVGRTAVDWHGDVRHRAPDCDLSGVVLGSLGHFPSRDALFASHGETLCPAIRPLADPLLSRWSARAA